MIYHYTPMYRLTFTITTRHIVASPKGDRVLLERIPGEWILVGEAQNHGARRPPTMVGRINLGSPREYQKPPDYQISRNTCQAVRSILFKGTAVVREIDSGHVAHCT